MEFYQAHVIQSSWLEEHISINFVRPLRFEASWRRLTHYFVGFHDEVVEALARDASARLVRGTTRSLLTHAVEGLTAD